MGIKELIQKNNNNRGYTILEMVLVIGVLSIIVPSIFTILLANMRAQMKVKVLQNVKTNGDNALATIESLIKVNAKSLHSDYPVASSNKICESLDYSSRTIYISDKTNQWFSFYLDEGKIASGSASGAVYLTSEKVKVTDFSLTCEAQGAFNPPILSISYVVSEGGSTDRIEEKTTLPYQTKLKLRHYE